MKLAYVLLWVGLPGIFGSCLVEERNSLVMVRYINNTAYTIEIRGLGGFTDTIEPGKYYEFKGRVGGSLYPGKDVGFRDSNLIPSDRSPIRFIDPVTQKALCYDLDKASNAGAGLYDGERYVLDILETYKGEVTYTFTAEDVALATAACPPSSPPAGTP